MLAAMGVIPAVIACLHHQGAQEALQECALMIIQLLSEGLALDCICQCLWLTATLTTDKTNHEAVLAAGVIPLLVRFLSSTATFSILEYAADTIETLSTNGL